MRDLAETELKRRVRYARCAAFRKSRMTGLKPPLPDPAHRGSADLSKQPVHCSERNRAPLAHGLRREGLVTEIGDCIALRTLKLAHSLMVERASFFDLE